MFKKSLLVATALLASSAPIIAQEALYDAVTAAMGEAIEDPRYAAQIDSYNLPQPDFSGDKLLVNSKDYSYPETTPNNSLLEHVLNNEELRLGWIPVGAPWSIPNADGEPEGFSVDYWNLVVDKMNAHYGKSIKLDWVEYTDSIGNNDMYRWLASDGDEACASLKLSSTEHCYDLIGGAYAINERRKKVSHITPAYYPLNMSAVRTPVPVKNSSIPLNTAEEVLAAAADPDNGLIFAALPDTGEESFLKSVAAKTGKHFTIIHRDEKSNVMKFAQNTEAHFVLGTNVRIAVTKDKTPEFCSDCGVIANLLKFDGVGFATALTK